ncbi:phage holin family protein [Odoribacter laneus]|uniref:Uncharacterized protein n=1 Tax=Odoribacter laneus YIT 12061 TaxID=742817 RepID=H1DHQ7_9BACT|nr:phage holin family protein [Odoribacter laneus]EHP47186.1 hypothetical protein HMPREF9449_01793 [Odoribacter laneus YIT 12061]
MIQEVKNIIYTLCCVLMGYIDPVKNVVQVLAFLCVCNFLCGLVAGLLCNREKFSFKKAFHCFIEVAIYVMIVSSIYQIGDTLKDEVEATYTVKIVTYVMLYFYSKNILKNLVHLFPKNQVFYCLDYLLGLEFVKHIPHYSENLKSKNKDYENH